MCVLIVSGSLHDSSVQFEVSGECLCNMDNQNEFKCIAGVHVYFMDLRAVISDFTRRKIITQAELCTLDF